MRGGGGGGGRRAGGGGGGGGGGGAVLVELVDEDGRSGWGEAAVSWRVTGESPQSVRAVVEGPLRDVLVGADIDDLPRIDTVLREAVRGNDAARSAADCAAWDLHARRREIPLADLIGAATRTSAGGERDRVVTTDITLSAVHRDDQIDELLRRAESAVSQGFGAIKVKVGTGIDDVRLLHDVRTAVGPDVALRADANQGWDVQTAIRTINEWDVLDLGIQFVEQPVAAWDIDGMAAVRSATSTPIVADESVRDDRDVSRIADRGAAAAVNIKLAKTGGISGALDALLTAKRAGLDVLIGCMLETHVGIAAAAALATTTPGVHDLDAGTFLRASPVTGGPRYTGQYVVLDDAPGTGIQGITSPTYPHAGELPKTIA
ncbi:enolase C-terminal domain-like protein [Curtobacterium sp. A7_M15]|nr:enolase C-terminal domain-like protein [Curtobacterium sp. A7_M15]MDP4331954.1 enolase C-terminal domain-like protein [Curtobacterium sp. A7_M15]